MSSVKVIKISGSEHLDLAYQIRRNVFVDEQNVPIEEEIDEFENNSKHFLAYFDDKPVGTARWRFTDKGVKLERFAVKRKFRGRGTGSALIIAVLGDIKQHPESTGKLYYLHSQLEAVPFYQKFGFQKEGDIFEECGIKHYKMKLYGDL